MLRTMLALLASGSVFLCGGSGRVKGGVCIDDIDVGNLSYAVAEKTVRERYAPARFAVQTEEGACLYSLDWSDDLSYLVRQAKKNQTLSSHKTLQWVSAEEDIASLCKSHSYDATDATVVFTRTGEFFYTPEKEGRCCLYRKTLIAALTAMKEGKMSCTLATKPLKADVTVSMLKERTQELCSFTTWFDGANTARVHNIALACTRITGTILPSGGAFSFNQTVGKRTEENGFSVASVIFDGEFVPGVGGGVCQASTTLMNCAVRAGLVVTNSRPHSLSVSYVPPSCDAMVSEYSDLEFFNPYPYPVYIGGKTGKNFVKFTIYGMPDGRRYELESNTLLHLAPPPEKIVEGDEEKVVRQEREGIASESYLSVYEGDTLISRTLFRRDSYAMVQGIRQIKREGPLQNTDKEQN